MPDRAARLAVEVAQRERRETAPAGDPEHLFDEPPHRPAGEQNVRERGEVAPHRREPFGTGEHPVGAIEAVLSVTTCPASSDSGNSACGAASVTAPANGPAGVWAMAAPLADKLARIMVDIRMNAPWKRVRPPSRPPFPPE